MPAATRPLTLAFAISAGLHAGIVAFPNFGEADGAATHPPRPLSVKVLEAKAAERTPAHAASAEGSRGVPVGGARYYTFKEVDVPATPLALKNAVRTSDNFPLGRIATLKLRLYISERGTLDRFEILEADHLPDTKLLDDFRSVMFRPAELGGRPVKSQKVVGISFVL